MEIKNEPFMKGPGSELKIMIQRSNHPLEMGTTENVERN